ncbi:hypothetical protein FH039_08675 [Thermococcus indicus]|uniref:CRISPR-associated protein n=1 Tax=Thermococcus indicus TaxID=2586643 RepID=A0A4Y5SLD3_9EURY|nr:CRISPR-associated ring nuclease [Thermococcus indicus]QDA31656.1 hypothetical protein FH039_08675 [Thermococcus indicus]
MRAYVTVVGTTPEAVFNPLWYLAEVYSWIPERVYLLWNDDVTEQLELVKRLIGKLSEAYRVSIEVIADEGMSFTEEDPVQFRERAGELIRKLKAEGHEVVVDITPGRKFMSALLLGAAISMGADEVTYLHLGNFRRYAGRLLFEVPMAEQRLFRREELTGRKGALKLGRRKKDSPKSLVVSRENLMALLNSLYLDGQRRFRLAVRSEEIASVKLGERARIRVGEYITLDRELHGGHSMVKEAIIAGMGSFRNWDGLKEEVKALLHSGRPLYIGFDTNALLFRVPSKLLAENDFYRNGNLVFDFVYSDEVQVEIGRQVNEKLPFDRELGFYSNQPTPRARLASLGRVELYRLREMGAERADSRRGERGDTKIALDYKSFAEEKDANVLVITLDDRAYAEMDALRGSGLVPFRLEWDFSFGGTIEGTWEGLRDTLYTLASVLGELNVHTYKLYGLWHGKNSEDWKREMVKLNGFEYGRIFRVL